MKILITGVAGFIGSALAVKLLKRGDQVVGIDNLNAYYDVNLKLARLARMEGQAQFAFLKIDIANRAAAGEVFSQQRFDLVVHLAAQVGVRYALVDPYAYIDANLTGFSHVLEGCREHKVQHFVFASSSSVYGANTKLPFSEDDNVDHPVSLYAATKKANELMAHSYAHLHGLPITGLRFFTVYGPWGRPDMATFKFTQSILQGKAISVFNSGNMTRDFTYIDDIIESVVRVLDKPPTADANRDSAVHRPSSSSAPYRVLNVGNSQRVQLLRYIEILEQCLGRKAVLDLQPIQPGEVADTLADTSKLESLVQFRPGTSIETGLARFVEWYKSFYRIS
jgi:UDP-glucuronate 4-epimerase